MRFSVHFIRSMENSGEGHCPKECGLGNGQSADDTKDSSHQSCVQQIPLLATSTTQTLASSLQKSGFVETAIILRYVGFGKWARDLTNPVVIETAAEVQQTTTITPITLICPSNLQQISKEHGTT